VRVGEGAGAMRGGAENAAPEWGGGLEMLEFPWRAKQSMPRQTETNPKWVGGFLPASGLTTPTSLQAPPY
jgi:hypothetical protein